MEKDTRTQAKRPRDEDFEGERPSQYRETEEVDEFERHKQSPFVILGIMGMGVLITVVSLVVFTIFDGKRRPVINVITPGTTENVQNTEPGVSDSTEPNASESGGDIAADSSEEAADYDVEADGILYHISNDYASVQKCRSTAETIVLPDSVDGYPLKAIWNNAFDGCTHLQRIKVPEGVWSLGEYAFANIGELTEIVLPASLNTMQPHCFDYTGGMTFISPANCFAEQVAKASGITWVEGNNFQ